MIAQWEPVGLLVKRSAAVAAGAYAASVVVRYLWSRRQSRRRTTPNPEEARELYTRDGFVVVRGLLSADDLAALRADLTHTANRVAASRGLRSSAPFEAAVAEFEAKDPGFGAALHAAMALTPAVAALWRHPRLLEAVHQLTGWPAIAAHPIFNIRPKSPSARELNYGMHQDLAFWPQLARQVGVCACWLPLVPVGHHNGTLQLIRGSHAPRRVFQHHLAPDGSTAPCILAADQPAGERVLAELEVGDCVFFQEYTVHGGCGPNTSSGVRWAVDLRWQSLEQPNFLTGLADCVKLWDEDEGSACVDTTAWAASWAEQERVRKGERAWETQWPPTPES